MGETVRSKTGIATTTIEGGEVVVRLQGQRKEHGRMVPWSDEIRVALAEATLTVRDRELVVRRGDVAVQSLGGCDPASMERFARELDEARRLLLLPIADCPHCGAPGQRAGQPCGYCGVAVSPAPAC